MSIYDYRPAFIFCMALAAVYGAVLGSFLNCAAMRIVRGESFVRGRSRCPGCGHELTAGELIPVVSWVLQKGRCRSCGQRISARYPLTELSFSLISALCLARFDLTPLCLRNYLFLGCLFLLTLTDLEAMIIPDGCHIFAAAAWAVFQPFMSQGFSETAWSLAAALLYGGGLLGISLIMDRVMGRDTLGGGDIKLFAVAGLYLDMVGTLFAMILACVAGLLLSGLLKRSGSDRAFPFGPSIALATAVMLLYGGPLVQWYLGMIMH